MPSRYRIQDYLTPLRMGREEGFDYLFKKFYRPVYFFACRYVKDSTVAEDVVTDSFIKVWNRLEIFESEAGMKSYLYKVVYHGCLREVRSRKSEVRKKEGLTVVSDSFEKDFTENMIRAETLRQVYEAMEKLPSECRKVFVKLFVEGKSVVDAAAELKVAISTVNNQKARGLKLMRMKLGLSFLIFCLGLVF